MANELAVREFAPPELLLGRVLMAVGHEVLSRVRQEVEGLAPLQLTQFGGSVNLPADLQRAQQRVIRLINLGLEKAAMVTNDDVETVRVARNILVKKPLIEIYNFGEGLFHENAAQFEKTVDRCQVQFNGLWYLLVDVADFNALVAMTDMDRMKGTLVEHDRAIKAAVEVERTIALVPYFPISEYGLFSQYHWGSARKGVYTNEYGLVHCFMLSLVIISLFRSEEELFIRKDAARLRADMIDSARLLDSIGDKEGAQFVRRSLIELSKSTKFDQRQREAGELGKKNQQQFLAGVLEVSLKEVVQFASLLNSDPQQFTEAIPRLQKRFQQYLLEVERTLRIKINPRRANGLILGALQRSSEMIAREVKKFYSSIIDPDLSNIEVARFWDARVYLASAGTAFDEIRRAGISERAAIKVDIRRLMQQTGREIVAASGAFAEWDESTQDLFCELLNPNVVLQETDGALEFARLLYALSPTTSSGWGAEVLKFAVTRNDEALLVNAPLVATVLKKVGWEHTDPRETSDLWDTVSDEVRTQMLAVADRIKVSGKTISYFVTQHPDTRLLYALLMKLAREDKLKLSSRTWGDLRLLASDRSAALSAINRAYSAARS